MAETEPKIKLKFRPTNKMVAAVVAGALVVCILAMVAVGISLADERQRVDALKDQAAQLEQQKHDLENKLDSVGSVDSVEQIAKDELDLVDPDTVIVQPAN